MKRSTGLFILLLATSQAFCQDQVIGHLVKNLQNHQSHELQEKIFVHTDKTFYLAGETLWFKVYSVDASFHKPLSISSIVYIEVLNKEQKPVLQTKIALAGGFGNGSVIIPASMGSGNYIFRAYTNWMKNSDADFFFQQDLHVVNTLKITATAKNQTARCSIQFFPEGGHALLRYPVKIAFKSIGPGGLGIDCEGAIVDQNNDTITRFKSLHNGMGNFNMVYQSNQTYYAILRLNDSLIKQKLPEALSSGITMAVNKADSANFVLHLQTSSDFNNTQVYLLLHTRGIIKITDSALVKDNRADFVINQKDMQDGISTLTLFNKFLQPLAERLIFKRPNEKLQIQIKTDQPIYENRKPVSVTISTIGTEKQPRAANMSFCVFQMDSLQGIPEEDILSYLYLSSDLKGKIESPAYYFDSSGSQSDQAVDNLMLTQGWRRFLWNDVIDYKKNIDEFLPELEGPVVNGKIVNKLTGLPVSSTVAFLSIPGADYAFSSSFSNPDGLIRFSFKDVYKNNVLVVQPAFSGDSNYRIDIFNAYSDKSSGRFLRPTPIPKTMEGLLSARNINNQVENTYRMAQKRQFLNGHTDTTSFYGKPDRTYNLDDYVRFQTMEEVLREYVEDVRIRKEGNKYIFKVRNRLFGTYFEESPLILLDGIPVSDASRIVKLNPLKIQKIEVVTHNYHLGTSVFAGIVNVKSYSGEMGDTEIDPNAVVVDYQGLQQQRIFYSPAYVYGDESQNHFPDFRSVLYWSPQVITGTDGKTHFQFYTSDLKGKFAALVQGISMEGEPGKAVIFFNVNGSE